MNSEQIVKYLLQSVSRCYSFRSLTARFFCLKFLICVFCVVPSLHGFSQSSSDKSNKRYFGIVKDAQGLPLVGVTVYFKAIKQGTVTNARGEFELKISSSKPSEPVLFSYIGFKSLEKLLFANKQVSIVMEEDVTTLKDVVITGIFKKRNSAFTGSALTVSNNELEKFGNKNLITSLANIDPAFNIIQNNDFGSDPNNLPNLQIRGATSINTIKDNSQSMINAPLVIMDGFEISLRRMMDLNPEDIESITLLKDGSATAIYGSQGANGVIVITSKQPEAGKLRVSYSGALNIEIPDLSDYHLLNARQKLELEKEMGYFEGKNYSDIVALNNRYSSILADINRGVDTDWLSKPLKTGVGQRHSLRIEGGDKTFRYSGNLSGNIIEGVMKGSNRSNYNGSILLYYKTKDVTFQNNLLLGSTVGNESPYGSFSDYVKLNPYWVPEDANGNMKRYLDEDYNYWLSDSYFPSNPLYNASLPIINKKRTTTITNNTAIEYRPHFLPNITVRASLGVTKTQGQSDYFLPRTHTMFMTSTYRTGENFLRKGIYNYGISESMSYTGNMTINFNKKFKKIHQIYCGVNMEISEQKSNNSMFKMEGFTQENPKHFSSAIGFAKNSRPYGSESTYRRVGMVGNINYSMMDKYYIDGSYRVEGASQFGRNKRFSPFYSIGAGWNIHNENFLKKIWWVERLKMRASYGQNGSQKFGSYQAIATYDYLSSDRYFNWLGIAPTTLENEDLKWQITDKYNVGMEAALLKNRLTFNLDVYYDTTKNLLTQRTLPLSNGFTSYAENLGTLENKGFEASISVRPIINLKHRISWTVTASIASNSSKIVKLSDALKRAFEKEAAATKNLPPKRMIREGDNMNAIYTVKSLGIDPQNGKEVFVKRNGEITYKWDAADMVATGVGIPKYRGNINSTFRYGNFTCSLSLGYHFGGQLYNESLVSRVEVTNFQYNVDERVYSGRWKAVGDHTPYKGLKNSVATRPTSRFVQDDNALTLKNVNLAYNFREQRWMKYLGLTQAQVSINMSDLFYISSVKQERGLVYPFSRRGSLSVNLTF